jgi:hypothetical protein
MASTISQSLSLFWSDAFLRLQANKHYLVF